MTGRTAPAGSPWDTSTPGGYRALLEHCGNPPEMVAELLRSRFPGTQPAPPRSQRRGGRPPQNSTLFELGTT